MNLNTPLYAEHQLDQLADQFEHWQQIRTRRDRILLDIDVPIAEVTPRKKGF